MSDDHGPTKKSKFNYDISAAKRAESFKVDRSTFEDIAGGGIYCTVCGKVIGNISTTIRDHLESINHKNHLVSKNKFV
jgi:hypothetical protein